MKNAIWLCGPIAESQRASRGGYESANLRFGDLLRSQGYEVTLCAYASTLGLNPVAKMLAYRRQFGVLGRQMRDNGAEQKILHLTPLMRHFIWWELRLLRHARSAGFSIVLDLRAGSKFTDYKRFGPLYRALFDRCLRMADAIAVEGEVYLDPVRAIVPDTPCFYLPNAVPEDQIADVPAAHAAGSCRLAYVGAVSEAKGVRDAVGVVKALRENGIPAELDLVGRADTDTAAWLEREQEPFIHIHGPLPFAQVRDVLDGADFFAFLTKWKGEGHSNALTEAMARGCIPIVTRHGFNESVIGECGVAVADRSDHANIAQQIAQLLQSDLTQHRQDNITRIATRFSMTHMRRLLSEIYGAAASR